MAKKPGPPKLYKEILTFNLTKKQYDFLEKECADFGVGMATVVRKALDYYIENEDVRGFYNKGELE